MQYHHQSLDGTQSHYEPFLKQNMISSNSSGGSSSTQSNLRPAKTSIRRSSSKRSLFQTFKNMICQSNSRCGSEKFYRKLLFVMVLLIILLLVLVLYLLCKLFYLAALVESKQINFVWGPLISNWHKKLKNWSELSC